MGPKLRRKHGRPEVLKQATLGYKVLNIRNIVKRYGLGREKCGRLTRKGRVFGTADLYLSPQRSAALDQKFIH